MAKYDAKADVVPALTYPNTLSGKFPTIGALRTAIAGSAQAASYPTAKLEAMTKNDLIYICRLHGIACVGI